ncbi:MAG: dihydropteroate synthase [Succinivibrionaceae bacterium]|nr:dihydropteroate synthase [Pseudomonadota bacterium]MDD6545496.1 dihydropteroate synthase [Pseudomonadota bacterium]MDY3144828.1 dihydropteroate synthase [Succinivibrionaceae bacterium]MDY6275745.1 dihydropteroate synthase [Succinivibrionaceae bacterium]MDY6337272.1 dihydropteroate synthase [Succinivibrionaceae bacterium]
MGILNVTPDSFSDGGKFFNKEDALRHAEEMVQAGAEIIDVGGESTRPGAAPVSEEDETARVVPVIAAVREKFPDVWISVDTSTPGVMRKACAAGCDIINDIRALRREGALEAAAELGAPVCIMHMQGEPGHMQDNPVYQDLIGEVSEFFYERIDACLNAGIKRENIILDPGFGFGKTLDQNYKLLGELEKFRTFDLPILAGMSRKSMIGGVTGAGTGDRLEGTVAAHLVSILKGADIIRVHDVKAHKDAVDVMMYALKYSKARYL